MSPHLTGELQRRRAYVAALAEGREPDEYRPIPERQGLGQGQGAPCGLGDPGLSDWSCGEGLSCVKLEDAEVGACLTEGALGAPCEYGVMQPNSKPQHDRVGAMSIHTCGEARQCATNLHGAPGIGACVPPYFVYQLRLDGYPLRR
jgi:hypothetical protein